MEQFNADQEKIYKRHILLGHSKDRYRLYNLYAVSSVRFYRKHIQRLEELENPSQKDLDTLGNLYRNMAKKIPSQPAKLRFLKEFEKIWLKNLEMLLESLADTQEVVG